MAYPDEALAVLDFWWSAGPRKWFARDDAFDRQLEESFGALRARAAEGALDDWMQAPASCLALILLLDQLPRNLFRGSAQAFATDAKARAVADHALGAGFDKAFPANARSFFYLPYMHAEDMDAQEKSVDLYRLLGEDGSYRYALEHMDIIRRFGRFPHRNPAMGRTDTPKEVAYLASGGFSA